jgi:hypothetical protein
VITSCSNNDSRLSASGLALKVGEFDGGKLAVDTAHFAFDVLPFSADLPRYFCDSLPGGTHFKRMTPLRISPFDSHLFVRSCHA